MKKRRVKMHMKNGRQHNLLHVQTRGGAEERLYSGIYLLLLLTYAPVGMIGFAVGSRPDDFILTAISNR